MFAVGALDAYYCDAYTDVVAATASSKSRQPSIVLPEWVYEIKFPIRAILEEYDNPNWRWDGGPEDDGARERHQVLDDPDALQ
jgi:hypothetical protein